MVLHFDFLVAVWTGHSFVPVTVAVSVDLLIQRLQERHVRGEQVLDDERVHRRALAIAIPASMLFAMYLLDTLGRVSEDLEDLQPFSAFHYYGSAIENGIDWADFWGLTLVALALIALAVLAFRRRDIYT